MPRVSRHDLVGIQPQVLGVRAERTADVDVAEEGVEGFVFERREEIGPELGVAGGLVEREPPMLPRLPERRADPDRGVLQRVRPWGPVKDSATAPATLLRMAGTEVLTIVVEIPKGSRNKYEVDHETGEIWLDRMLFTSMQYPADYGYIDGTLGGDGDPLDALVFVGEPTFPGCRIRARPVGLFRMQDEKGEDEKILCVPLRDPMWSHVGDLGGLPLTLLNEIEHFFQVYKDLEGHKVATDGYEDRANAVRVIEEAIARHEAAPGLRTRPS